MAWQNTCLYWVEWAWIFIWWYFNQVFNLAAPLLPSFPAGIDYTLIIWALLLVLCRSGVVQRHDLSRHFEIPIDPFPMTQSLSVAKLLKACLGYMGLFLLKTYWKVSKLRQPNIGGLLGSKCISSKEQHKHLNTWTWELFLMLFCSWKGLNEWTFCVFFLGQGELRKLTYWGSLFYKDFP